MKLETLRKIGSQSLDDMAEFILTDRSLIVYEQRGNGIYYLARAYKVVKQKFIPCVDMEAEDALRMIGVGGESRV